MEKSNYFSSSDYILSDGNVNAYDFMDSATKNLSNCVAMTYFGNEITYKEMKDYINLYANKLLSYGLKQGDRISLILPNIPEIVYYIYAAWKIGVIVNLIEPRFNESGIADMIEKCNSKLVITTGETYKTKIKSIIDKIDIEKLVIVNPTASFGLYNIRNVLAKMKCTYDDFVLKLFDETFKQDKAVLNKDFLRNASNSKIDTVYFEDIPASIIFTSGTSGTPKAACFSQRAYNLKVREGRIRFSNTNAGDKFLAAIPFFSAYGSFGGMHYGLSNGMNLVMIPKFSPQDFGDLVCKYTIQTAIGVPNYWADFAMNYDELKEKYNLSDLSFLKCPVSGGDVISPQTIDFVNKILNDNNSSGELIIGYGSTETGGPSASTVGGEKFSNNRTSGLPFPGVDYLLVDPETHEVLENANFGEIALYDPAAMMGYYNDPLSTAEISIDYNGKTYYLMGDLFEVDEQGLLYFRGRTKRAIMLPSGHTVHALPIETALLNSGIVEEVCTVGIRKDGLGEGSIPVAFIVLKDGIIKNEETIEYLKRHCLNELSERNIAYAYVFVDKLPYTLMGKIDYRKLEKSSFNNLNYDIVDYTFFPENNNDVSRSRKKKAL